VKILFIVPYVPTRIRTRPLNLIRSLIEAGHEVTVATLWTAEAELQEFLEIVGDTCLVFAERITRYRSLGNCVSGLASAAPLQARYSWNPAFARRLDYLIAERTFDVVHVEHLRGGRYALFIREMLARHGKGGVPVVWDSVDCISALFKQAAKGSRSLSSRLIARLELGRTQRYETRLVRQLDRVVVTSGIDRRQLLDLASTEANHKVSVVPNGVDLDYFKPIDCEREKATLVISGKMSYHANEAAAVHFVRVVLPRIWARQPDVRVWITGKDPSRRVRDLSGDRVVITGTVPDIRPYLQHATIAVSPILYGAGIQNKVLEALACGTPVVATSKSVAGLSTRAGLHLRVAETEVGLGNAILSLLRSPEERRFLGESGRCFVEMNHDWRSSAAILEDVYREAMMEPGTVEREKVSSGEGLR